MDQKHNVPVTGCFCDGEFDTMKNRNGFTLIELLVVVAIIGIIASVGVVAYSGYTSSAKHNVTIANHNKMIKFIKHSFTMCDIEGGTLKLGNNKNYIDCNGGNTVTSLNTMKDQFVEYFNSQGFTNVYNQNDSKAIYVGTNGGQDLEGRMRFDHTDCPGDASRKQLIVWVKTHKEYYPTTVAKDGWCN